MLWMTREKKDAKHVKNNACKKKSQWIERCRDTIEQKPTSIDRPAIEHLSRGQKVARSIDLAIKRCRDCDKKQLKSSIEKLGVKRCRGAVEIA